MSAINTDNALASVHHPPGVMWITDTVFPQTVPSTIKAQEKSGLTLLPISMQ